MKRQISFDYDEFKNVLFLLKKTNNSLSADLSNIDKEELKEDRDFLIDRCKNHLEMSNMSIKLLSGEDKTPQPP